MLELIKVGTKYNIVEKDYVDGCWVRGISIENLTALDSAMYLERIGTEYLYIAEAITRLHSGGCTSALFDSKQQIVKFA